MSVQTILPFGNTILRKNAQPVTKLDAGVIKLLNNLTDTLYPAEGRPGLAAPQIGVLKRVIVLDCGDGLIELINPEIMELRGEQTGPEACLSLPGHSGIVKRANYAKIRGLNRKGQKIQLEGIEFLAKCLQHEIDHLDGILYIDRILDDLFFEDETNRKVDLAGVLRLSKSSPG